MDTYWHGSLIAEGMEEWTKVLTDGAANYCTTQMEDNATLTALRGSIDRKQPQAGEDGETQAHSGAAPQEWGKHAERRVTKEPHEPQIQRQDCTQQQADAEDMRGIHH
jgi:hypothetical protein